MRAKTNRTPIQTNQEATLLTHVRELQIRLLVTAAVLVGAAVVAYFYYGQILDLLRRPLNAPLYINSVSGSFAFVMKICMVAGIAVSVPLIVYNFIMFVRPAFPVVFTRKRVFLMTFGSVVAAAGGVLFGYFFIIPGAIHFFGGFQVNGLHEMIAADGYLNFVVNVLVTFVIMFQLPIIASLIDRIKPISPKAILKGEKWAVVVSIVVSLLVPFAMDLMTQALIAAPIFILYNVSFVVIAFQHWYARRTEKKTQRLEAKARTQTVAPTKPVRRPAVQTEPLLATNLQPHPQLAEVLQLQTAQPSKPVHAAPQAVQTISRPTQRPMPSIDGMNRVRTHPGSVIRQATNLKAPARPTMARPAYFSDIR